MSDLTATLDRMSVSEARVVSPASLLIAQIARGTRRRMEEAAAPTGLRSREWLALQHLREQGPAAQQALAALIGIDATNLVAVLNGLEDRGLIERRRDRADRRRAIIALSPPGEQLLAGLDRALSGVDDEILASLSRAERQALHAMLLKVASNIAADCTQQPGGDCAG
jgi:DNA-binding MarR family transcriptional regulator